MLVDASFEAIRREHQQALDAVHRLEAGCAGDATAEAMAAPVDAFLGFFETTLEPHMRREEAQVYPLLERYLPRDVGSADAMLREHETLRSLVELMRQACSRLVAGDCAAAAEAATLAQDVALLLRDHIRKEDGVINPMLETILSRIHA